MGIDAEYVRQAMPTTFRELARVCAASPGVAAVAGADLARCGDVQAGQVNYCFERADDRCPDAEYGRSQDPRYDQGDGMRWWMTRRVERQARRMHDMMERLNVDKAALVRARQGQDYAEARARCVTSRHQRRKCLRWLDKQPPSGGEPAFCPNLRLFEQYRKS